MTEDRKIKQAYDIGYGEGILYALNLFKRLNHHSAHGHWAEDCFCSECGAEAITEWNETGGAWVMTPFCPFCGAEMEMDGEIAR